MSVTEPLGSYYLPLSGGEIYGDLSVTGTLTTNSIDGGGSAIVVGDGLDLGGNGAAGLGVVSLANTDTSMIDLSTASWAGNTTNPLVKFSDLENNFPSGINRTTTTSGNIFYNVVSTVETATIFGGGVDGDAERRVRITSGGQMYWGAGTSVGVFDCDLERTGANEMTFSNDLVVDGDLTVTGDVITNSISGGGLAIEVDDDANCSGRITAANLRNSSLSQDAILTADANGDIVSSGVEIIEATSGDATLNIPMLSTDPTAPENGDLWVLDDIAGNSKVVLKYRAGGTTYAVDLT